MGAAAAAGIVAASAGGTWLLAGNHGAPASVAAAPRTTERAPRNAPKQDLRAWLAQMEEAGELVTSRALVAKHSGIWGAGRVSIRRRSCPEN